MVKLNDKKIKKKFLEKKLMAFYVMAKSKTNRKRNSFILFSKLYRNYSKLHVFPF